MRRTGAVFCVAVLFAGCGFDSARNKPQSNVVAPVISQPELHRAHIDAVRRQAAARESLDDESPGTARVSSPTTREPLGRVQPWEETEFD